VADEVQFDPAVHGHVSANGKRGSEYDEFRQRFGTAEGFQIEKVRRPRKKTVPAWAKSEHKLRKKLFSTRGNILRNYEIARLYYLCNWTAREVSEQLKTTQNAVKKVLKRLKGS
jgi:hypothetical protein